jgi:serine/threonine protein kinase/Tfp pilus assembly protein PilF
MHCALCGVETPPGVDICPACEGTRSSIDAATGAAQDIPAPVLTPGSSFGQRYLVIEAIGGGGMGRVYKAVDRQLGRTVALKLVRSDLTEHEDARRRFRQELALAQDVTHPNVCRVYDLGDVGGVPYISMEYVDGQSLADLICSMGRLSPHQTAMFGRQICAGLQAIHDKSIIHRDLKPGNVMVDRAGQARIMDFGVAHRPGEEKITKTGMVVGTMLYAAPEYLRGAPPDARCDIFSLGLILFEMLTGKHAPGDQGTLPLALRDRADECPPPSRFAPDVSDNLDDVVLKCLERNPAKRFQSAREVGEALAGCQQDDTAILATPIRRMTTALFRPGRRASRARRRILALAAVVLVMASATVALKRHLASIPSRDAPATIALLPLKYIGDPKNSHFGSLLPILIGHDLEANERISVAPFAASQSFEPDTDPKKVAVQLGVDSVLSGQIHVREEDFTAKLRLARSSAKEALFSKELTGPIGELRTQTNGLADDVANALGAKRKEARPDPLSRDPGALEHYVRGREILEQANVEKAPQKAADEFRLAIEIDPNFTEAHAYLATALWHQYQRESRNTEIVSQAFKEARRSIELNPALPEARLALGVTMLAKGDSVEAASSFESALRLAPSDDTVYRRIAQAYAALGRDDDAEMMFKKAIQLRKVFWLNYNSYGIFMLRRGRPREAIQTFKRASECNPDNVSIWTNLAMAHALVGELNKAEAMLRTALELQPSVLVRNNLGTVLYSLGRFEEAEMEYQKAIDSGMKTFILYVNLGDAQRQQKKTSQSIRAYQNAIQLGEAEIRLNPEDSETAAYLAVCYAGINNCDESRRIINKISINRNPIVDYSISIANVLCKDIDKALLHVQRAMDGGLVLDVRNNPDLKSLIKSHPHAQESVR